MRHPQLVVADYRADRVYGISDLTVMRIGHGYVAEHAGILDLGGEAGGYAFADDLRGELAVMRGLVRTSVPIAIPAEHIAADPTGRYVAITTGLGAAGEPWTGVVTIADLDTGMTRRFRSRVGEPGVGFVADRETGAPFVMLRHREPGAIEAIPLARALALGAHVPALTGSHTATVADDGHGDVADANSGIFATATSAGLERFIVDGGAPVPIGVVPWPVPGRAFYLRLDARTGRAVGITRGGAPSPTRWTEWENHLVEIDLVTGEADHAPLPPGLAFRFASGGGRTAVATIHPDGDLLTILDRRQPRTEVERQLDLPALSRPPVPGRLPWDPIGDAPAQRRAVAVSPTGERVAVTRGGDGEVHLVSDAAVDTVTAPTPLDEGGLLFWPGGARDGVGR